jgi:Stress responsive A/B Barrel Domain
MIAHIIRFSFKETATDGDVRATLEALRERGRTSTVSFSVVGEYSGDRGRGHTHTAVYALTDLDALERYIFDPGHRQTDPMVHSHITNLDFFDVSDGDESDLATKIAEIQRRRLESDPEVAELVDLFPNGTPHA